MKKAQLIKIAKKHFEAHFNVNSKFYKEDVENAVKGFKLKTVSEMQETLDRLNAYTSKSFEKQVNSEINKMNKAGLFDIKNMKVTNCLD